MFAWLMFLIVGFCSVTIDGERTLRLPCTNGGIEKPIGVAMTLQWPIIGESCVTTLMNSCRTEMCQKNPDAKHAVRSKNAKGKVEILFVSASSSSSSAGPGLALWMKSDGSLVDESGFKIEERRGRLPIRYLLRPMNSEPSIINIYVADEKMELAMAIRTLEMIRNAADSASNARVFVRMRLLEAK